MSVSCKYSKYCGGCIGFEKDYTEQLKEKTEYVKELFKDFKDTQINDCVGNYYPFKYRNKIHLAFTELKGKTLIGFFEEGSTKVTDIDNCLLFGDWATKLISILREFVSRFKIRPFNKFGSGILRYAHARCVDNKLQLTLVVTTDNFAGRKWLYLKLKENYKDVSFYLNINRRTDRAVFDKVFKFVDGNKYLTFDLLNVKVALTPSSFLQVNLPLAGKMYKQAESMLGITNETTVLDLYSGIGITSMMFARIAKNVISIEEVEGAVNNAKYMAKINNVNNVTILSGKCESVINKLSKAHIEDLVVFVDPARAGLDINVINALKTLLPRMIVYMSCNPETCVNNIKHIVNDNKYISNDIRIYDMFPYTKHAELLASIIRID